MIGKVHGRGMTGITSNLGNIKAYCLQKEKFVLNKGINKIPLNFPFPIERMVGATVTYGGYIGSQPMLNDAGNYASDYGLSFYIDTTTKDLQIFASAFYPERNLNLIIFYV